MNISRRDLVCLFGCLFLGEKLYSQDWTEAIITEEDKNFPPKEARFYKKLDNKRIECNLCPLKCRVADKERGGCGARENRGGTYYTLVHSRVCAAHIDPIEKKPLFHFLPSTDAFSIATPGCNMWCKFCQNWEISQFRPEQVSSKYFSPKDIQEIAKKYNTPTIAFTYTEPVIFTEYILDICALKEKYDKRCVSISNGFIEEEPLKEWIKNLDAIKVDLKAFNDKFYEEITGGNLKAVLKTLELIKKNNVWLEIVVLLVPTLNDSKEEIKGLCNWVYKNLGKDVPVHFTRFHPTYRIKNLPPTPVSTIEDARNIGLEAGLEYVYTGNVPGNKGEKTYCPKCKKVIIDRFGFQVLSNDIVDGRCKFCGNQISGVWK
jgi:pyruvate formate lyase activating enzyme